MRFPLTDDCVELCHILRQQNICLKSVSIARCHDTLLSHLSSYTGIERLEIDQLFEAHTGNSF
jgi:hypothetical protein